MSIVYATAGSAIALLVLATVLTYQALRERRVYLGLWAGGAVGAGAWAVFITLDAFLELALALDQSAPLLVGFMVGSELLVLDGVLRFLGRRLPRWSWALGGATVAWAVAARQLQLAPGVCVAPAALIVPVGLAWGGVLLLRSAEGAGANVAGTALVAMALHFVDAPLLIDVESFAPVGFLVAGGIHVWMATGLLLAHSDRVRTELELLQARLVDEQRAEAVRRVAGGVAHDFNNLLTAILSCATLIAERRGDTPALTRAIQQAAERAAGLTQQLLALSQHQVLAPEPVDLRALVLDMRDLLASVTGERIRLELALGEEPIWVRADRARLESVVVNLVVNACDAMPDGGRIGIRAHPSSAPCGEPAPGAPPTWGVLEVWDTGAGIGEADRRRIFEPFYTTKPDSGRNGLGLAIVRGTVTQSGGTVEVESTPGRGSTFRVRLPTCAAPTPAAPPAPARAHPRDGGTVLLVEDEEILRMVAEQTLAPAGYDLLATASAEEAAGLAENAARLDLLVTDVVLAGMNGVELAGRLQQRWPDLPVLFVSGYPEALVDRGVELGAHQRFLAKPFTPQTLLAAVKEMVGEPGHGACIRPALVDA